MPVLSLAETPIVLEGVLVLALCAAVAVIVGALLCWAALGKEP